MSLFANLEILLMCMILTVMLFLFSKTLRNITRYDNVNLIYGLTFFGCLFEAVAYICDGHPDLMWLNYISNILYMGSIELISIVFLCYCNERFPKPIWKTRKQLLVLLIPAGLNLLVLCTTFYTGLIFTVSEDGFYFRSSTFFVQLIPYAYLLFASFLGIYWFSKSETTFEKNQNLVIALFAVPPFILGGSQLLLPGNFLDIMEFSIVISLFAEFAVTQNNKITIDHLTKLPNRQRLDSVLKDKISERRSDDESRLFFLMGDLDSFKKINDTYGHLEGDRALVITADILCRIAAKYQATPARFGGDEFAVIVESQDISTPMAIIYELSNELEHVDTGCGYKLSISMGISEYSYGNTVTDIIKAADNELYRIKNDKKSLRK